MSDDNNLEQVMLKYEQDVASQKTSGSVEITDEHRALNKKAFAQLISEVPFRAWDIHCVSEADLVFRYLIATKFNVDETVKRIKATKEWRVANKINEILWKKFPEEFTTLIRFVCVDAEHAPVYLWRPDPARTAKLMTDFSQEMITDFFVQCSEAGRRIALSQGVDRATSVLSLSLLGIRALGNTSALGLLKRVSQHISTYFPESNRRTLVIDGGFSFSALRKVLGAFLDERQMAKIVDCGSGDKARAELSKYLDVSLLPKSFTGDSSEAVERDFRALAEIPTSPVASPPAWEHGAYRGNAYSEKAASPAAAAGEEVAKQ